MGIYTILSSMVFSAMLFKTTFNFWQPYPPSVLTWLIFLLFTFICSSNSSAEEYLKVLNPSYNSKYALALLSPQQS
ncbi:hypothetical protein AQUCO_00500078v1 [Aquilegia coerulea]|uniref:Uncharacterized protein n=1 Tax=Aquilegia coerulea TaxID=218851 RepID=A0A2G5EQA6_AQUCA|nr:hypothetical protein AQUCO_00500078v1 [Aquilegia coerulea]